MNNENYFEMLEDLKRRISNHKSELEQREKIITEFKDVSNLLNDVRSYISELQDRYNATPTNELRKELEAYTKEEKDYLELMNDYASQISQISHSENFEKENEFLKLALRFQDVSDRMKEIEKQSKKFGSKNTIGTNRVETVNAEGRKQYIHQNLLNEYIELSKEKSQLLPLYKQKYKEFMESHAKQQISDTTTKALESKDYYNDERLSKAPSYVPTNQEYEQMSNQDKINLEKKYYDDMSDEEKISYCRDVINRILSAKNTGKKKRVKINGEHYIIPEKLEHTFFEYHKKLSLLTNKDILLNEVNNDKIQPFSSVIASDYTYKKSDDTVNLDFNNQEITPFIPDEMEYVGNNSLNGDIIDTDYVDIYSDSSLENKVKLSKSQIDLHGLDIPHINNESSIEPYSKERVIATSGIDSSKMENQENGFENVDEEEIVFASSKGKDESNKESNKESLKNKIFNIIKSRKPKDKKKLVKGLIAASLAVITAISVFGISKNKGNDEKASSNHDTSFSQTIDNIVDASDSKEENISDIDIGDSVTVNINAPIYDNIYDAKDGVNGLNAYFASNTPRTVKSIALEYNGQIVFCDSQKDVDLLKAQGAKAVSIGTSVDNLGYEGFYNSDDVIVQFKDKDLNQGGMKK